METQYVALIATVTGAVVGASATVAAQYVNARLTIARDRRLIVWQKEVDRFYELEELCGKLVESLVSYKPVDAEAERLAIQFEQLEEMAGRLGRYPEVRESIRDLQNVLGRQFADKRDRRDDRATRADVEPIYRAVLAACDRVLGSHET